MKFSVNCLLTTILSVYCVCVQSSEFDEGLKHLTENSWKNPSIQTKAVKDLIRRILPLHFEQFNVIVDPNRAQQGKDAFELLSEKNGTVTVSGSNGVAAASGFNYYLKYLCKCHISWETSQLNIPQPLPSVNIRKIFNDRFRYYQNVCTTSYSFVWWDWKQWEKHIDWIVLNSFNLVLAFNGQETIWSEIYQELGLSQNEIDSFFTGPAFLSWLRMGNVRKWGGPLSFSWHKRSFDLQKLIVQRLRSFGVLTVLPAFAGHLPRAFKKLYPEADMVKLGTWNDFNDTYCCPYFLSPSSNLFKKIGKMFIDKQIEAFGTDNIYSCDSFNENKPPSSDLTFLSNVSKSIFSAMTSGDPKAIWLMQGWLFVHDALFWTKQRAKALITAVPKGKMIILDLQSEQFPMYTYLDQYFGQPYIWCMLHNFGGTLGMYGSSDIINEMPIKARQMINSTMVGTGLTMEGINQNYVIYDLMTESAWRSEPTNLKEWFEDYTIRRYGGRNQDVIDAWNTLQMTIYNLKTSRRMRGQYAITRTPSWSISTWIWYDPELLKKAVLQFRKATDFNSNAGYRHDLVDFVRQTVQVFNDQFYYIIKTAYRKKDMKTFEEYSQLFLSLMNFMEESLATNEAFLLSEWVKSARAVGSTPDEKDQFEYNARNQITLWGPNGEIMNYAIKQWSGVVSDFLLPRWKLFLSYANETLIDGKPFNETYIKQQMFEKVERPFTFKKTSNFEKPKGDIRDVIEKNSELLSKMFNKYERRKTKLVKKFNIPISGNIRDFSGESEFVEEDYDYSDIQVNLIR